MQRSEIVECYPAAYSAAGSLQKTRAKAKGMSLAKELKKSRS